MGNILAQHDRARNPTKGLRCRLRTFLNKDSWFKAAKYSVDEKRDGTLVFSPKGSKDEFWHELQRVCPDLHFEGRQLQVLIWQQL